MRDLIFLARKSSWRASEPAIRFWDEEMRIRMGEEGFFSMPASLVRDCSFSWRNTALNQYINHVGCACHTKKSTDLIRI